MGENRVGVIGWPVEHSLSPTMHNAAFEALGMKDWRYDLVPVPPDIVGHSLKVLRTEGGYVGVNVTVPHKQAVLPHVRPDDKARALGAANTIDFRTNTATNTDVTGLIGDLQAHGVMLQGAHVLVLGAGGAARAAVYGLVGAGARVTVANRTVQRANVMLADLSLSADMRAVQVKPLAEAAQDDVTLIINCTSVGLWPKVEESPWPDDVPLPGGVTLYDTIYRPERTRLMEQAEAGGGQVIGGLGMLVRQGALSFQIWTGVEPPLDVMFEAARTRLRAQH